MKVIVFGAGGATGRHLVRLAAAAGHDVTAVVRRPAAEPSGDGRPAPVRHVHVDASDPEAVDAVVAGHDAVLSSLGARPSRRPISVYSQATAAITTAMRRHGVRRLVAVTSSVMDPRWRPSGEALFTTVIDPLINRPIARTAHDDMRRMETALREGDLDWTVVRPSGLFDHDEVTEYRTAPDRADGLYTARSDLAAAMLDELERPRHVRGAMGVITTDVRPSVADLIRHEIREARVRRGRVRTTP